MLLNNIMMNNKYQQHLSIGQLHFIQRIHKVCFSSIELCKLIQQVDKILPYKLRYI